MTAKELDSERSLKEMVVNQQQQHRMQNQTSNGGNDQSFLSRLALLQSFEFNDQQTDVEKGSFCDGGPLSNGDPSIKQSPTFRIKADQQNPLSETRLQQVQQTEQVPLVSKNQPRLTNIPNSPISMIKVETLSSQQKRRFKLGMSQSSALCTSLRSSRLNMASVASELEFNQENASLDSIEISNNGAATSNTLQNR